MDKNKESAPLSNSRWPLSKSLFKFDEFQLYPKALQVLRLFSPVLLEKYFIGIILNSKSQMYGLLIALFWFISFVCIILLSNWRQELFQISFTVMFFLIHGSLDTALTSKLDVQAVQGKTGKQVPVNFDENNNRFETAGRKINFLQFTNQLKNKNWKTFLKRKERDFIFNSCVVIFFFNRCVILSVQIGRSLFQSEQLRNFESR